MVALLGNRTLPRHVAVNLVATDQVDEHFASLRKLIAEQQSRDIPILTLNLPDEESLADWYASFFSSLAEDALVHGKKVRCIVVGDWYSCSSALVDAVKLLMERTREYDGFFVIFGVRFDGRQDLLRAVRLLARKVREGRLDLDGISVDLVKESLATGDFIPPELIVETAPRYSGLLLWDAPGAVVYYLERPWPAEGKCSLDRSLRFFAERQQ